MERDGYTCQHCLTFIGRHGDVDHRLPLVEALRLGMHGYEPDNLQYLCHGCHSRKTFAENPRKQTENGADWRAELSSYVKGNPNA